MTTLVLFLLAVLAVMAVIGIWSRKRGEVPLFCPDRDAEQTAAMNALWPLPSAGFPPTRERVAQMLEWAATTQLWLDSQDFDPCTRKAYQGWINHVGNNILD